MDIREKKKESTNQPNCKTEQHSKGGYILEQVTQVGCRISTLGDFESQPHI